MKPLTALIDEMESQIPQYKKSNTSISAVTAGWHIAHSFMALRVMCNALSQSDPAQYSPAPFSIIKNIVMLTGRIPRGKGKSPETVKPADDTDQNKLNELSAEVRNRIASLAALPDNAFFKHPVFGLLNKKQAFRFMQIHTNHHLLIVKDIVA